VVTALYNVIWSFIGYSNANYALSETKNPVKTLKRAAPAALILVSILYMLVNVSGSVQLSSYLTLTIYLRLHISLPFQKKKSSPPAAF
jgi:amino acid transporter